MVEKAGKKAEEGKKRVRTAAPKSPEEKKALAKESQKRWRERQVASGKKFLQIWVDADIAEKIAEMTAERKGTGGRKKKKKEQEK